MISLINASEKNANIKQFYNQIMKDGSWDNLKTSNFKKLNREPGRYGLRDMNRDDISDVDDDDIDDDKNDTGNRPNTSVYRFGHGQTNFKTGGRLDNSRVHYSIQPIIDEKEKSKIYDMSERPTTYNIVYKKIIYNSVYNSQMLLSYFAMLQNLTLDGAYIFFTQNFFMYSKDIYIEIYVRNYIAQILLLKKFDPIDKLFLVINQTSSFIVKRSLFYHVFCILYQNNTNNLVNNFLLQAQNIYIHSTLQYQYAQTNFLNKNFGKCAITMKENIPVFEMCTIKDHALSFDVLRDDYSNNKDTCIFCNEKYNWNKYKFLYQTLKLEYDRDVLYEEKYKESSFINNLDDRPANVILYCLNAKKQNFQKEKKYCYKSYCNNFDVPIKPSDIMYIYYYDNFIKTANNNLEQNITNTRIKNIQEFYDTYKTTVLFAKKQRSVEDTTQMKLFAELNCKKKNFTNQNLTFDYKIHPQNALERYMYPTIKNAHLSLDEFIKYIATTQPSILRNNRIEFYIRNFVHGITKNNDDNNSNSSINDYDNDNTIEKSNFEIEDLTKLYYLINITNDYHTKEYLYLELIHCMFFLKTQKTFKNKNKNVLLKITREMYADFLNNKKFFL